MSKKVIEAFVRAKPAEISVTETYRYKAEISDNDHISFKEADGKIKVKFFYDGHGFHWKILGFMSRWLPLCRLRKRWAPLSWLISSLKAHFGPKAVKKCFDVAALEDARKCTRQSPMAKVGHLILRGFQKPNFGERWPESKGIPLQVPINDLERKLAQSQKYELCYTYPLQKPEAPLIGLDEVRLTDESPENPRNSSPWAARNFGQLYSKTDEELHLKLKFSINGGKPELDEDNQLPDQIVKYWWQNSKKIQLNQLEENEPKKKKRKSNKKDQQNEGSFFEQIVCIDKFTSLEGLGKVLNDLARRQGGYLLIRLDKSDEVESFKEQLLRVSLKSSIPILEPYKHDGYRPNKKPLAVVPVPTNSIQESNYRHSHLRMQSEPLIIGVDRFLVDVTEGELAKYLSAIANTTNGKLVLVSSPGKKNMNELEDKVQNAAMACEPKMKRPYTTQVMDGLLVLIKRSLSTVHTVNGMIYIWKDGHPEQLSVEESYKFIRNSMALNYPLVSPLPFISYACIDWSYFDPRETDGVRYDPQKKVIKWPDKVWFRQIPEYKFEVVLPLAINRPIELYRQGSVSGQVHIEIGNNLKSGLAIEYFDALGKHQSPYETKLPQIKSKSKVELEFNVTLDAIFSNRLFRTSRTLEFEGIRPSVERLEELKGMMGDLGLESIEMGYVDDWLSWLYYSISNDTIKEGLDRGGFFVRARRPPRLNILLQVGGSLNHISRERKQGERADRMRVQTGHMKIMIIGEIEDEPSQTLSILLNRLQQMITERFSHIGVQVV